MKKLIIAVIILFAGTLAKSQTQELMEAYTLGQKTDSLIVAAYYAKDTASGRKYMDNFLVKYNTLTSKEKGYFKEVIESGYYNLSCTYALLKDKKDALNCLEKSQYSDYDHLLADKDMDILRKEPRFIKCLKEAKSRRVDYLATLQKAPEYNMKADDGVPEFTYQSPNDSNLAILKKTFNLDSIAGRGTDISRMINLMRWVHNLIPHNGNKGNPDEKNALSFITVCKKDHKSLNCRGLAILLNEVYLADGFKSRFVTCLPKDPNDQDCHVITMVWSESYRKWIWMDPTFNAYVMNEKGELLSIEEVRDRLIKKQTLILNPDADHNHENSETKQDYLENYMAKNLYKLECPVKSEYNYETFDENKEIAYTALIPGGTIPKPDVIKNKHGLVHTTMYYSSNPKAFWKEPAGQSKADYEAVMNKFRKFYDGNQADSIANMFSDSWGEAKKTIWSAAKNEELIDKFGEIESFLFMGAEPEDGVVLFKTRCTKSTHALGFSLDSEGKFLTFRFATSSPYINGLLASTK